MVKDMSRQWLESTVVLSKMQMLNNPLSKSGEADIPSDMFQWEKQMSQNDRVQENKPAFLTRIKLSVPRTQLFHLLKLVSIV